MSQPLNMVSLPVHLRDLRRLAAHRGHGDDEGRALHHLLGETFGPKALQPFRLMVSPGGRAATLYAYTPRSGEDLRDTAAAVGAPEALAAFAIDRLAVKTMPDAWKTGRRLAFDLRVRPVRRLLKPLAQAGPATDGKPFAAKAEVDAFLVDAIRRHPDGPPADAETPLRREEVYRDWLAHRLKDAAELIVHGTHLVGFERRRVRRGSSVSEGPDATFHGELRIGDPTAFARLLATGVGRHAAYGYGMLLLRSAGR
ncbi:type I-E CRISPR-associated protein Cas6/Cse3/CasE [Stappia sp. TSB10P1A]|uniref:type I-E CRISPR-associated protein Cas6/Cse3/CasE n=1 Tax=Stappia sp. TSB10P1A TaxID=2003585 RepID=UPI001643EF09|nr:type I-E CRISPR-associated protein Cas6/Cse3/CasE [Stappia sp. TSB10P1A]